ncbi:MAG TPA: isochorismatase family protein [Marinobacter sp.]|nr:isochorismatase family protein [Marinobacter sp.]
MLMKAEQATLLLIDVQEKLMPAISRGAEVADRCTLLATVAGLLGVPVIGTEQVPEKLGPNLQSVRELCLHTVAKHHFDACPHGLIDALPEGRQQIVIAGCEAHVCVLQTALSLLDAGYKVWVVADATGSRNEFDQDLALDRLYQSGARIVTTEMVAFEWVGDSRHPAFRDIQALIK